MKFHIENMTCDGCARGVTKAIQLLDPQAEVTADPPSRSVEVNSSATHDELVVALSKAGFPARTA
jgi:copper chaperone